SFSWKSDLNNHHKSHTGQWPYECREYGKSFSHSASLIWHQTIHTREWPYQCLQCGK
ncbi:ZNF79 protein, partial [Aegithalos caudatus]|nr:ZNF79 protein [Aegithalos caudatus]